MSYFDAFKISEKEINLKKALFEKKLLTPFQSSYLLIDKQREIIIEFLGQDDYVVRKKNYWFSQNSSFVMAEIKLKVIRADEHYKIQYRSKIIGLKFSLISIFIASLGLIIYFLSNGKNNEPLGSFEISFISIITFSFLLLLMLSPFIENRRRKKLINKLDNYLYSDD